MERLIVLGTGAATRCATTTPVSCFRAAGRSAGGRRGRQRHSRSVGESRNLPSRHQGYLRHARTHRSHSRGHLARAHDCLPLSSGKSAATFCASLSQPPFGKAARHLSVHAQRKAVFHGGNQHPLRAREGRRTALHRRHTVTFFNTHSRRPSCSASTWKDRTDSASSAPATNPVSPRAATIWKARTGSSRSLLPRRRFARFPAAHHRSRHRARSRPARGQTPCAQSCAVAHRRPHAAFTAQGTLYGGSASGLPGRRVRARRSGRHRSEKVARP